jgi:Recombination endonuclease VII
MNENKKNIIKKCTYHGDLSHEEIYISKSGWQYCLHCKQDKPPTIVYENISYLELKCPICELTKSVKHFHKNSKPGSYCITCDKIRRKEYRKRPEVKEREYRQQMERFYEKRYGISLEDYELLLKLQNYCCGICKKNNKKIDHRSKKIQRYHVDHCHKTNKVRGLLCAKCNQGIGFFDDDILILESCIKYLQNSNK